MYDLIKGNNSPNFVVTVKGTTFSGVGWFCDLYLADAEGVISSAIPMTKAVDNLSFSLQLSPTQTDALTPQLYRVFIILYNDSLNFKQTKDTYINVVAKVVG